MASSLINNAIQIYSDPVYGMADEGMGKAVEISEEVFAGSFEFPIEGLAEMTDVRTDLVFDERSAFSMGGHGDSCFETSPRVCGADLDLGESKEFPPIKILTAKTVGTYVAKNNNITVEEVVDEPVVKKAAPKRRPAPAVGDLVAKQKRTTLGRAAPVEKDLVIVPVVQNPEPISVVPAVIAETAQIEIREPDSEETVVMKTAEIEPLVETESRIDVSSITNYDEEEPLVETEKEEEKEKEKEIEPVVDKGMILEDY
ncbi:hypothetical protein F511_32871 [Dorcoceras hygrometricum]|uniref:Uncharacterized protein n=1 Tax=Dorcoceras hygrometricum TaxID=472368 RepID=A0A2Z7DHK9_9LAMI|nr:hypothetical protein F511_32871 [Dorcoceras hygrometricum]